MARIRTIKPEFWTSEQVVDCSPTARLLFIGMWTFCDDNGIHPDSIKRLKMEIFPSDGMSDIEIQAMVSELLTVGLIEHYTVENQGFWRITGWNRHQKIEKPTYRHPLPNECSEAQKSTTIRRGVAEQSSTPRVRNGMESNGMERNGENTPHTPKGATQVDNNKQKPKRAKGGEALLAFLDRCKAEGVKPIPQDDQIFGYIRDVGISDEMLVLAWFVFKNRHIESKRTQKDWRAHFRNAVKGNWAKLWFFGNDGEVSLTTAGQQAQREFAARAKGASE